MAPGNDTRQELWGASFRFLRARFFSQNYVDNLIAGEPESRKTNLLYWFKLSSFTSMTQIATTSLMIDDLINDGEKKEKIVAIIANAAANAAGLSPEMCINDLIRRTNWSMAWKTQATAKWNGNTEATARKLVLWALSRKINTTNPSYTTIVGLLEPLIRTDLDREAGLYLFQYS